MAQRGVMPAGVHTAPVAATQVAALDASNRALFMRLGLSLSLSLAMLWGDVQPVREEKGAICTTRFELTL